MSESSYHCCASCLTHIHVMPTNTCQSCGIPLQASLAPGPCGTCLQSPLPQTQTHSLYLYQDRVREALLAWKLQGQVASMDWLLNAATQKLTQLFSSQDLLVPVPMPIHRMRKSGLHHSADLCQRIAHIVGCQYDWTILRRTGKGVRQSSLKGKARQRNLHHAFTLYHTATQQLEQQNIQGKIWVIDDILTTGATLRHACKAMQPLNQPVYAFSFARTWHRK